MLRSIRHEVVIVALLLCALSACPQTVDLTPSEQAALSEIQAKGLPWAAQRIAALEYILAAVPTATFPDMVEVLDGRDLHVYWSGPYLDLTIAPRKEGLPPPIQWKVPLPTASVARFVPPPQTPWWVWPTVGLSLAAGVALGAALK